VVLDEPAAPEPAAKNLSHGASDRGLVDWSALREANPDLVAWVMVDGTDISLPVLAPADGDMEYYLRHDLWGSWSLEGTPFLDHRSDGQGPHRLVYGHHLYSGGQFSTLQKTYLSEAFDGLGTCHWLTPDGREVLLEPLCALRVDAWFADVQRFDFADREDLRQWLSCLCAQAPRRPRDRVPPPLSAKGP